MQLNPLDIITTVLGLTYILFEYKASKWMWVVGFLMQSLGVVLYYQKGLYADCGMETNKACQETAPLPHKEGQGVGLLGFPSSPVVSYSLGLSSLLPCGC